MSSMGPPVLPVAAAPGRGKLAGEAGAPSSARLGCGAPMHGVRRESPGWFAVAGFLIAAAASGAPAGTPLVLSGRTSGTTPPTLQVVAHNDGSDWLRGVRAEVVYQRQHFAG